MEVVDCSGRPRGGTGALPSGGLTQATTTAPHYHPRHRFQWFSFLFLILHLKSILEYSHLTMWQGICTRFSCHFRSHVISPGIVLNLPRLTFGSCVLPIHFCLFVKIPNSSCLLPTVIIRFQSQPPVIDNGPGHQQWVSFCAKQDTQPIICWWDFTSVRYQNSPRPSERLNVSLLAGMYSSPASIFTVNAVPPGPDLFITAFRDELMDAGPIQTSTICLACRQGKMEVTDNFQTVKLFSR